MAKIIVKVELRPSEDENKVINTIKNFFDFERIRKEKYGFYELIIAESSNLYSIIKVHKALREERILDAARKYLIKGMNGNVITFMIHKQAAAVNRLTFVDSERESPLGPVTFIIEHENPMEVIDWLAPKTANGVPLWEKPIPT
ncbi:MAG: RNA-binding domain-containing protein [Sulfolobaceae archaeon]